MTAKKSAPKIAKPKSAKAQTNKTKATKAKKVVTEKVVAKKVQPENSKDNSSLVSPQEARIRLTAFKVFCLASLQPLYKGGVKASIKRAFAGLWPAWLLFLLVVLSILLMPIPPATISEGLLIAIMVPVALVLILLNVFLWQSSRFVEQTALKILYRATALLVIFTCLTVLVVPVSMGLMMVYNYFVA